MDPTDPAEVLGKATTHTFQIETRDGYKQTATLTLYPGVAGRTPDRLAAGWATVGGTGAQPCGNGAVRSGGPTGQLVQETTYYVFGTLAYKNDSSGFEPPQVAWFWGGTGTQHNGVMGAGFSSGAKCTLLAGGESRIIPNWQGDSWGPVPVVIGVTAIYNPKYPNGDLGTIRTFLVGAGTNGAPNMTIDGETGSFGVALPDPSTVG